VASANEITLAPAEKRTHLLFSFFFFPLKIVYVLISLPSLWFVLTLAAFMFSSPSLEGFKTDRVAFPLLLLLTAMNVLTHRKRLFAWAPLLIPLGALTLLAIFSALQVPYDRQTWSFLASDFLVPLCMFYASSQVFIDDLALKHFFIFCVIALAYLIVVSIGFLAGAEFLVFPHYILDPSIGIQSERARGPFLQAVANGAAINILGLLVLYWWQKKNRWGVFATLLIIGVPLAILGTMTRAVWLGFIGSAAGLLVLYRKKIMVGLLIGSAVAVCALTVLNPIGNKTIVSRLEDEDPIEYRMAVYRAGIEMVRERPLFGWGINQPPYVLPNYLVGVKADAAWAHNTYLEILLEHGVVGLVLYGLMFFYLFRLGRLLPLHLCRTGVSLLDRQFASYWRLILAVYLFNGLFVVMNYRFINALLFSLAGMIFAAEINPTGVNKMVPGASSCADLRVEARP
jgi:O-antigen ligase